MLLIAPYLAMTQSDLLFNNYKINRLAHNPASIENNGMINAYLGVHQQWIGFEDAPNMQWAYVSGLFERQNMGVALNILNQSVGATLTQNIKIDYSYRIYLAGGHIISLGIAAGVYYRKFDYSGLRFEETEPQVYSSEDDKLQADFDFGIEYTFKNFSFGFASNHISVPNKNATILKIPIQNHIYANYLYEIANEINIVGGADYFRSGTIDCLGISADLFLKDKFNAGLVYRTSTSFIIRAGVQLTPIINVQYSYDMGSGSFASYNSGVHELVLSMRFGKKSSSYNSPRFVD